MATSPASEKIPRFGLITAVLIIVADMIGTGILTLPGFTAGSLNSGRLMVLAWSVGGFIAFCGAVSYARLAFAMPHSGGEYFYLSRLFHPAVGFLSAWISMVAGFSAPLAAAAIAFGTYGNHLFPGVAPFTSGLALILAITALHMSNVRGGVYAQNAFSVIKILLILLLIAAGSLLLTHAKVAAPSGAEAGIFSPALAMSLIFISFAYSGWNASTYIASEIKDPERTVPLSLFIGVAIVAALYVLLNITYVRHIGVEAMKGKVEVGYLLADRIFGGYGAKVIAGIICLLLVSSVSSIMLAGSRVLSSVGEDFSVLGLLAKRSLHGVPYYAVGVQCVIAIFIMATSSFDKILYYIGFSISAFSFLAVLGSLRFIRNRKDSSSFAKAFFLLLSLLFLVFTIWSMLFSISGNPSGVLYFLITIAIGYVCYLATSLRQKNSARGK
jgi:basic amino acid/polyamine antiporter, APA family